MIKFDLFIEDATFIRNLVKEAQHSCHAVLERQEIDRVLKILDAKIAKEILDDGKRT